MIDMTEKALDHFGDDLVGAVRGLTGATVTVTRDRGAVALHMIFGEVSRSSRTPSRKWITSLDAANARSLAAALLAAADEAR